MLRGEFIARQAFLRKEEKSQFGNLTQHLNELEKEEQTKPKVSRRKEIIKIKEEINQTKSSFFEEVNKIDKPLARFTEEKKKSNKK